jgi:hypothetical protein
MSDTTEEPKENAPAVPNYVMVPIPDAYVPAVMQHVLMLMAKETVQQWEPDEVVSLFAECDEPSKAVLSSVARATLAVGDAITDEVSEKTMVPMSEVMKIVQRLNETSREMLRPALITPRSGRETLPNGREVARRYLDMNERLAQFVVDAEKADLAANPHVLPGSA